MFSARAFVGWYNGLPENQEVSLGSIPPAPSSPRLSQGQGQLLAATTGVRGSDRPGRRPVRQGGGGVGGHSGDPT